MSFQSTIYLQNNFYYTPDELFRYNQTSLLPTFSVYRSGNITEDAVSKYFGDLKTGLGAITAFRVVGIILAVLFLVLLAFAIFKIHQINVKMLREKNGIRQFGESASNNKINASIKEEHSRSSKSSVNANLNLENTNDGQRTKGNMIRVTD